MNTTTTNINAIEEITSELAKLHHYWNVMDGSQLIDQVFVIAIDYAKAAAEDEIWYKTLLEHLDRFFNLSYNITSGDDPRRFILCNVMASLYRLTGNFVEAEKMSRCIAGDTVASVVALARDIKGQNNPGRLVEVENNYRWALSVGFKQLENNVEPSALHGEMASVYVALAEVYVEMGELPDAENELSNMMCLTYREADDDRPTADVSCQMHDGFKLMLRICLMWISKGELLPGLVRLQQAVSLAARVMSPPPTDAKVVEGIRQAWVDAVQMLNHAMKSLSQCNQTVRWTLDDALQSAVAKGQRRLRQIPEQHFIRSVVAATQLVQAALHLARNETKNVELCLDSVLELNDRGPRELTNDPLMTETLFIAYQMACQLEQRQRACHMFDSARSAFYYQTGFLLRLGTQQHYDERMKQDVLKYRKSLK